MKIALVAHDAKKADMLELVRGHRELFSRFQLCATGTTGRLVSSLGFEVDRKMSGPLGGDLQIGAAVAAGEIGAVIFLRDPLSAHPHDPDISALMKVCDTHLVPLATNVSTAELLLMSLAAGALRGRGRAPGPTVGSPVST
jgi:methylglyoxal synthase